MSTTYHTAEAAEGVVVHGTSDEILTCEHCGRTNLKKTVAISVDGGVVVYYGTTCAAAAVNVGKAAIAKAIKAVEVATATAATAAKAKAAAASTAEFHAFLSVAAPTASVSDSILALGGFAAAKAAFVAVNA